MAETVLSLNWKITNFAKALPFQIIQAALEPVTLTFVQFWKILALKLVRIEEWKKSIL